MNVLAPAFVGPSALNSVSLAPSAFQPASLAAAPLQAAPTGRGVVAVLVTLLVVSLFYAITLHLAATFFIGEVPTQKAATVGPVPAVVSILLGRYGLESVGFVSRELGVVLVLVLTLLADALAIGRVYDLAPKPTAVLTLLHLAFATVMGIALLNIFGLL